MKPDNTEAARENMTRHSFPCRIKICGLRTPQDVSYVNEAGADYAGFVFAPSRRRVSAETAVELRRTLRPGIKAVGVFVDGEKENILRLLHAGVIDAVQFHGTESEADIRWMKEHAGCTVIKAVKAESPEAVLRWRNSFADYLLLDAGRGDGRPFDWQLADRLGEIKKPFFLAGGLDTENVNRALELFCPFGVDVSSGVEIDGKKDREKILTFIKRVRSVGPVDCSRWERYT